MRNLIVKIKNSIGGIHWPSMKEIVSDTLFTVSTTAILAILVSGWMHVIEIVVDWAVSLF